MKEPLIADVAELPEATSLRSTSKGIEIDFDALSIATGAVAQITDLLPGDRIVLLEVCEPSGTPAAVLLRDRYGQLEVVASVPEDRRSDLAKLLLLAGWTAEGAGGPAQSSAIPQPAETQAAARPAEPSGLGEILFAEERQRALADGAESGMAIVSGKGETLGAVLEANAPLGRILGVTRGQLAGLPFTSLIAEHDAAQVRDALQEVAADGGTSSLEATVVPRIGRQRLVTVTIAASLHSHQPGKELVVRVQDTTGHAGLVAELRRTVERLERSNQELAGLAGITAHDLAAPLRAVSGLVDLLPQADASPETRLTIDAIRSAVDRMQAMVAGITGYVQTRSEKPGRAPVNLNELVGHVRETLESDIEQRKANFTVEELPSVFGEEHQLERVFLNLISNALKYAGNRLPDITVYGRRVSGAWRVSVADRGIGVKQADRDRIFELFARGEFESGSGIGLATCRRIVELHGGRIWVEPNEPTGAIFSFTLPDEPTVAGH